MFCSMCGETVQTSFKFCPKCGKDLRNNLQRESNIESEKDIIESYFFAGYEYNAIISFLDKYHDIHFSLSTVKRRLREYGLKRRNAAELDVDEVKTIMRVELDGPSCMSGYRSMWHTLRLKHGLYIPRNMVQELLKELDPVGAEERRRHRLKRLTSTGPNECWHVDGYDKLKPFGFPIHAAVDGYSRRVLWLKVTPTNNDPSVVARYYLECVTELQGCPKLLRTDPGAENGIMAAMQCCLRASDDDELSGEKSHRYGPSTGNQRIECWWSHLRKSLTTWWINVFKDLIDRGVFMSGNTYHNECLWFCFHDLLQQDLDFVKLHWNTHYIRPSRHDTVPGKPDELFFLPERSGGEDHLQHVTEQQIEQATAFADINQDNVGNDYQQYFQYICDRQSLDKPSNWYEALSLFQHLVVLES